MIRKKMKNYVVMYWCIKELYLSSFRVYLNELDRNFFTNKYLKTLEILKIKEINAENDDCLRIVSYFIKTLKKEYEVRK